MSAPDAPIPTFILDPESHEVRPFDGECPTVRFAKEACAPFAPLAPTSKRERRHRARAHTRGRRGARPVPPVVPFDVQVRRDALACTTVAYRRHRLTIGRREAALYLPEEEDVTTAHLVAVERAMGGNTSNCKPL